MGRPGADDMPSKAKAAKSVRWTGRDDHQPQRRAGPSSAPGTPQQSSRPPQEDYFSFSGASGNSQSPGKTGYMSGDDGENSSSSSDDDDDDDDEHSANVRAATRANTWFNRLRQSDENPEDAEEEAEPLRRTPPTQLPNIEVSHAAGNPFANVMDIGTKTSGGLAPGGSELRPEDRRDPLDEEYRERRNHLLASLDTHSQPSSPQLPPLEVSREMDAIPLVRLNPASPTSPTEEEPSSDAIEAEQLRRQLESVQRKRGHETEEAIAQRKASLASSTSHHRHESMRRTHTRESSGSSVNPLHSRDEEIEASSPESKRRHSHDRHSHDHHSHDRHSHDGGSSHENDAHADDEEELKRLEEIARQEAEEHAKQLVKSHLGANLLNSKVSRDGYVENHNYLYDSDLIDHDAEEKTEPEDQQRAERSDSTQSKQPRRNNDDNSATSSSFDSEKAEKDEKRGNTQDNGSDSSSDSENEDEEDHKRKVNLRGDPDYVPPPKKVKEGVLGSLLRLYAGQEDDAQSTQSSMTASNSPSVSLTPTPAGTPLGSPQETPSGTPTDEQGGTATSSGAKKWKRPGYFRTQSSEDPLGRETKGRPKWYKSKSSSHTPSLGQLAASGLTAASTAASNASHVGHGHHLHRPSSSGQLTPTGGMPSVHELASHFKAPKLTEDFNALRDKEARKRAKKAEQQKRDQQKKLKKARLAEQARITVHIADVLQRQRFILRLCRALMLFGAPSHRLEEYLKITARVLEIDGQFLYMPGCMLVSFGDATTHTSETKLVKVTQGLNLNKLDATHLIYKEVVHDIMGLEEASSHIDHLLRSKNLYAWYFVIIFYAMGCVCSGMFSFGGHWQDMPIIFLVGGSVGFLQYWVQPRSDLYSNVFEVSSSIIVSFVGRAFGSIGHNDKDRVFCFAAIVQGSLALILPGYIILTGALELQSRNLVAGSVRMFYANIYSLFLSFGITLGSAIYGWCDKHGASGETKCHRHIDDRWKILFVPMATLFMGMVNQAGPRQLPVMVCVGSSGYVVQYFVQKQVENASSFTSAIGAFTMGILGNLYSRVGHGLAFAAMLPGIFTLVPSGLAAQGSLVAGVAVADAIVNKNSTNSTTSATAGAAATTTAAYSAASSSAAISELGNSMTQVAVGITVGLFAATLVVYPLGLSKKRSGLFTF